MSSEALDIIAQAIHDQQCTVSESHLASAHRDAWRKEAQCVMDRLLAAGTVEWAVRYTTGQIHSAIDEDDARRWGSPSQAVLQRRVFPLTEEWTTT